MKKIILTTMFVAAIAAGKAQVMDTVAVGTSYANQVWYSLPNDNQGSSAKNNWDLAFDVSGFGSTILINSITGTTLWAYTKADTSGWSTLDTAGIKTWPTRWNSDTSWAYGAIGRYADPANPYDLDWGIYSSITHIVTGDSLYVIKLANGKYKKLWIESLSGGAYTFRYANIDNTELQTTSLTKSNFTGKNFGYYSLQNDAPLDREPLATSWDLLFTQYTTFIPSPYTVTGVLQNAGVRVADCKGITDTANYINYSAHTFNSAINEIGYDWKTFTGSTYVVADSTVYFVKRKNGDIWKMIFLKFGGSSTGNMIFRKELLTSTGITDANNNSVASMSVYPNPSNGNNVNIIYNLESNNSSVTLKIYDITGRSVYSDVLNTQIGLHQYLLSTENFKSGIYISTIDLDGKILQQKLIIQ